jgi:hypothetical protein
VTVTLPTCGTNAGGSRPLAVFLEGTGHAERTLTGGMALRSAARRTAEFCMRLPRALAESPLCRTPSTTLGKIAVVRSRMTSRASRFGRPFAERSLNLFLRSEAIGRSHRRAVGSVTWVPRGAIPRGNDPVPSADAPGLPRRRTRPSCCDRAARPSSPATVRTEPFRGDARCSSTGHGACHWNRR